MGAIRRKRTGYNARPIKETVRTAHRTGMESTGRVRGARRLRHYASGICRPRTCRRWPAWAELVGHDADPRRNELEQFASYHQPQRFSHYCSDPGQWECIVFLLGPAQANGYVYPAMEPDDRKAIRREDGGPSRIRRQQGNAFANQLRV